MLRFFANILPGFGNIHALIRCRGASIIIGLEKAAAGKACAGFIFFRRNSPAPTKELKLLSALLIPRAA